MGALPVRHIDEGAKGRYVIEAPGNAIAEMSYSRVNAALIIIDHTQVPEVFRGTGTGLRLLEALIADARQTGTKVIPVCPFAAAQFDKHPQWADIVSAKVRVNARPGG
nr:MULTISPECIES: GNAT family N-acetyltransferase [unclassified Roseitalea]